MKKFMYHTPLVVVCKVAILNKLNNLDILDYFRTI